MRFDASGTITRVRREPFYRLDYERDYEVYSAELQHIWESHPHTVVAGAAYQNGCADTTAELRALDNILSSQMVASELERLSCYGYYQWRIVEPLALTAGVSYDRLRYPCNLLAAPLRDDEVTDDQVSPKAGVMFTPWPRTTLRALYARSLGGFFNENSFRLEATQIAGLNQSFRSVIPESAAGLLPGAHLDTYAVSLEQSFAQGTWLGIAGELLQSDGERTIGAFTNSMPFPVPGQFSGTRQTLKFEEKSLLVTANQLIRDAWYLSARYRVSEANLQRRFPEVPATAIWQMTEPRNADWSGLLQQLTCAVGFQHRCGFFAQFQSR